MYTATFAAMLVGSAFAAAGIDYSENGANWGETVPLCDTGLEQSPIDLHAKDEVVNDNMRVLGENYFNIPVDSAFSETDYGFKITWPEATRYNQSLTLERGDGETLSFTPLQFHWHAPSEHTIDGKLYDAEVHFVHTYSNSSLYAVIGVLFEVGDHSDFVDNLFECIDTRGTADATECDVTGFLGELDMTKFWSYEGSFTTPPCTEGVKWTVIRKVMTMSASQLKRFTENLADDPDFAGGNGNNRLTQPLNERTLYLARGDIGYQDGASTVMAGVATAVAALAALSF